MGEHIQAGGRSMMMGIAHRLDVETSGCLVLGTTRESFAALRQDCRENMWNKRYVCLVYGHILVEEMF